MKPFAKLWSLFRSFAGFLRRLFVKKEPRHPNIYPMF